MRRDNKELDRYRARLKDVIYTRDRFIMTEERALAAIEAEGLRPSPAGLVEYLNGRPKPRRASPKLA
jgi:hypothetical protein